MLKGKAMYSGVSFSPDGNYLLVTTIQKPFSYIVPFNRFPSRSVVKVILKQKLNIAMLFTSGKRRLQESQPSLQIQPIVLPASFGETKLPQCCSTIGTIRAIHALI